LILSEYVSYYQLRFHRRPQLCRKLEPDEEEKLKRSKKKRPNNNHNKVGEPEVKQFNQLF
jgi:hypothetical protein